VRAWSAAAGEQGEVLGGGEQVEQRRLLRAVPGGGAAVDGPGIGGLQPGADPQQGGLARTVLPGDRHDLPRVGVQADVAEHGPAAVGLAQAGHREQRRRLAAGSGAGLAAHAWCTLLEID